MGSQITCKYCNTPMERDDTDFHFRGCKDEYWVCPHCNSSAFVKVRYGEVASITYSQSDLPCYSTDSKPIENCSECLLHSSCANSYHE